MHYRKRERSQAAGKHAFLKDELPNLSARAKNALRKAVRELGLECPAIASPVDAQRAIRELEKAYGKWGWWVRELPAQERCGGITVAELRAFAIENGLGDPILRLGTPSLRALHRFGITGIDGFRDFVERFPDWKNRVASQFAPMSRQVEIGMLEMGRLAASFEEDISPSQWRMVKEAIFDGFAPGPEDLRNLIRKNPSWKELLRAKGASQQDIDSVEKYAKASGLAE
jgi:hypothetical protein